MKTSKFTDGQIVMILKQGAGDVPARTFAVSMGYRQRPFISDVLAGLRWPQ